MRGPEGHKTTPRSPSRRRKVSQSASGVSPAPCAATSTGAENRGVAGNDTNAASKPGTGSVTRPFASDPVASRRSEPRVFKSGPTTGEARSRCVLAGGSASLEGADADRRCAHDATASAATRTDATARRLRNFPGLSFGVFSSGRFKFCACFEKYLSCGQQGFRARAAGRR